jgi:DNA repair exonuclease SbcCD ATPase subunit
MEKQQVRSMQIMEEHKCPACGTIIPNENRLAEAKKRWEELKNN